MKTLQFKVTTWQKMELPDDTDINDLIRDLKEGTTPMEIFELSECQFDIEPILETEELIQPEENNWNPTIELYDCENCSPIWTNEIKKYQTLK